MKLHGAKDRTEDNTEHLPTFADRIRESIDTETALSTVVLRGGFYKDRVDSFVNELSDQDGTRLRGILNQHIDRPERWSKWGTTDFGSYTEEEAEEWIAEYEQWVQSVTLDRDE